MDKPMADRIGSLLIRDESIHEAQDPRRFRRLEEIQPIPGSAPIDIDEVEAARPRIDGQDSHSASGPASLAHLSFVLLRARTETFGSVETLSLVAA
ncbi:hypothetical protein GCM10009872_38270 [Actinopolymorpha rutila]